MPIDDETRARALKWVADQQNAAESPKARPRVGKERGLRRKEKLPIAAENDSYSTVAGLSQTTRPGTAVNYENTDTSDMTYAKGGMSSSGMLPMPKPAKPAKPVRTPGVELQSFKKDMATFKKGGAVKGWGKARGARAAKVY